MQYFVAENTGKGFITHEDNQKSHISGFPGNVWVTENNQEWATRVGAVEKTKAEAQAIVDAEITAAQEAWDALTDSQKSISSRPSNIVLP